MKFLHTMIRVKDIEKSLDFYINLLGLQLNRQKSPKGMNATLYYLSDESKCCEIELTYNHKTPESGYQNGDAFGHLAFQAEDFDEFTKKLHAFGLEYTKEPYIIGINGTKVAFINDPDGNSIEIVQKGLKL